VTVPSTVHQAKFNMGTVLALAALHGHAGVDEFERDYAAARVAAFRDRVSMAFDDEVDRAYPARWIGKVTVTTRDGRTFAGRVDEPKGDPGNTLSRDEIARKVRKLAAFSGAASDAEVERLVADAWQVASRDAIGTLFPEASA
ncbi:MAG: MmgE/PrpD family protein, partial [Burkholderia sp.]|nr:MmgE/PrpD family protein [Burkholderia sp.]